MRCKENKSSYIYGKKKLAGIASSILLPIYNS